MKFLFASLFVVISAGVASADWKAYKAAHGKSYNAETEHLRQQIFQMRADLIDAHNSDPSNTFQRDVNNPFSDMTDAERAAYLGARAPSSMRLTIDLNSDDRAAAVAPPATLDYRTNSCIGAVKNQLTCGSCWAFSAIASLEFSYCKIHNAKVILSEQQLVDCDKKVDTGCNGGFYTNAWTYLRDVSKDSQKSTSYPYTGVAGTCKFNNATSMLGAKVSTFSFIQANATAMQLAIQQYGIISVAIQVVNSFYSYKSGVYSDTTCTKPGVINHAVNVVGWGTLSGVNYWIVRNSWGATWGQSGYILMKRGVNMCNIESYAAYVVAV